MLPFSLVSALMSAFSGYAVTKFGRYRIIIWSSFGLFTLGMGLMTMLDADTPVALQEIYPLLAGIGLGPLFQTPLVALTAAMPPAQMAVSVASYALVRSASGTVGITVAGAIFNAGVQSRLKNIPEYANMGTSASQTDLKNLIHIQPPSLAKEVVAAYGDSLRLVWIVLTPLIGVGFLCSLGIKGYSLNRVINQMPDPKAKAAQDVEKQESPDGEEEDATPVDEGKGKSLDPSASPALETLEKGPVNAASSESKAISQA
jgi:MFS family permease